MFDRISEGRWWDRAWSLIDGCTPVSPGCDHCWAAAMAHRFHKHRSIATKSGGSFSGMITVRPDRLDLPLRTKKPTAWAVWNDLFHEDVPLPFLYKVFDRMIDCHQHIFLVLTKRHERLARFQRIITETGDWVGHWPKNIWLGVTAENQEMADQRIPILLQIPAAVRFVSVEPMLGPVELTRVLDIAGRKHYGNLLEKDVLLGREYHVDDEYKWTPGEKLDWVICGGESGPKARPAHPDWFRSLRDQCQAAGVAYFFKQWGEWLPVTKVIGGAHHYETIGKKLKALDDRTLMEKVGKKAAGRLLGGREWNEVPHVKP